MKIGEAGSKRVEYSISHNPRKKTHKPKNNTVTKKQYSFVKKRPQFYYLREVRKSFLSVRETQSKTLFPSFSIFKFEVFTN